MAKYTVDIDGILCENGSHENYKNAKPIQHNIDSVNNLFTQGNIINIFTSRKRVDKEITLQWLKKNGVNFHSIQFDKPTSDYYIDDKAIQFIPFIDKVDKERLVICVSGGLDSTIAYYYAKKNGYEDITCLFFNIGQPYVEKERNTLKELGIDFKEINLEFYKEIKMKGDIIPNRNNVFATIASLYGNRIWIVGLKYENHYLMFDKNDSFYNYCSLSLSQSNGKRVIVETPFRLMSKTDIFRYCEENNLMDIAMKTTSCYHPTHKRCGKCALCFRRWVAEETYGIKNKFESNPKYSDEARKMVKLYKEALKNEDFTHYQKERIIETLNLYK